MRKLLSFKIVATIVVAASFILVLSSLTPFVMGGAVTDVEIEILVDEDTAIVGSVEVDDFSYFLGESFIIRVVVQYDTSEVVITRDSILQVSLAPFERTGRHEQILYSLLTDEVAQFVYEVEVRSIEGRPSRSYFIEAIPLEYALRTSGDVQTLVIGFEYPIYIGRYYPGEKTSELPLRPSKGPLDTTVPNSTLLYWASRLLFVLAAVIVVRWFIDGLRSLRAGPQSNGRRGQALGLGELIVQFRDPTWLASQDVRSCFIELQTRTLHYVEYFFKISPKAFWDGDEESLLALREIFVRAYQDKDPTREDVGEALGAIEKMFAAVLPSNGSLQKFLKSARTNGGGRSGYAL